MTGLVDLPHAVDVLVASLESVPGFLGDVAESAGLTVPETRELAIRLKDAGLLCALDEEPWAPTEDGYLIIRLRKKVGSGAALEALRRFLAHPVNVHVVDKDGGDYEVAAAARRYPPKGRRLP